MENIDSDSNQEAQAQHAPNLDTVALITKLQLITQGDTRRQPVEYISSPTISDRQPIITRPKSLDTFEQFRSKMILFRFLNILRRKSGNVTIDSVKQEHLQILNDLSADVSQYPFKGQSISRLINSENQYIESHSVFHDISYVLMGCLNVIPTVLPNNYISIAMEVFVIIIALIQLLFVPIILFFNLQDGFIMDCQIYIYTVLTLDILRKLNTGIYMDGVLILQKKQILKKYMKEELLLDIITILQFWTFLFSKIVLSFFLIRFIKVNELLSRLELNLALKYQKVITVCKLLFIMIFATHLMSCIMFWIEDSFTEQWSHQYEIGDQLFERYVESLYWAVETMVSVGYGDIVPSTNFQRIYTMLAMIIGCCLFGYMLNTIGSIIDQINQKQKNHAKYMQMHDAYFGNKPISQDLKLRVREYAENSYKFEQYNINSGLDIITQVSEELRQEFKEQVNGRIVINNKVLQLFSMKTQKMIMNELNELIYLPTDLISNDDQISLYILNEGTVNWIYNKAIIEEYKKPQSNINIIGFFTGINIQGNIQSVTYSSVFTLNRTTFIQELQNHSSDLEYFHQIKDDLQFNQNYKIVNQNCSICLSQSHIITKCPRLHFMPNYDRIIQNSKLEMQNRKYKRRPRSKSLNCLGTLRNTQANAILMVEDNYDFFHQIQTIERINSIQEESHSIYYAHSSISNHDQYVSQKPTTRKSIHTTLVLSDNNEEFETYHTFNNYFQSGNIGNVISIVNSCRKIPMSNYQKTARLTQAAISQRIEDEFINTQRSRIELRRFNRLSQQGILKDRGYTEYKIQVNKSQQFQ